MLTSQLFWRVLAVYAALTVGTALAFVAIFSARHRASVLSELAERLSEDAEVIRAIARPRTDQTEPFTAEQSALLSLVTRSESTRSVIEAADGRVLWHSHHEDATFPSAESSPEVQAAESVGRGERTVPKGLAGQDALFFACRLDPDDPTRGIVRTALPLSLMQRQLSAADSQVWGTIAAIGVLALAVTYVVVGRIIGPLESLTEAARRMAAGETPGDVPIRSNNELGALAAAFNSMNRQLSARIHDLQDQRRQLEGNSERLETVFASMIEGVIAVDAQQRIMFANNAAFRMLDLKPVSAVGRTLWETVRLPQLQQLVQEALAGESPPRWEFDVPRTQSTVAAVVSKLPGDPPPGAVLVMHDITELRRLENLRREFVQNVSHELKTPLASISACAETLLDGALEDEAARHGFVERIAEQSERLNLLILDLMALARLELEEQQEFDLEPTEIGPVIDATVSAHQDVAQSKRIRLMMTGPRSSVWGLADEDSLRTILDNLLDNAINYTPADGHVTVRWRAEFDSVVIEVEDTGVGIAKEHQARIFERFYRIDKARSRELGGTGLGLAIVKHLCQMFGGSVRVNSQLGQGTTFTISLRLAAPPVLVAN